MQRRDLIKLITMGAALPALTPDLLAFLQDAHPATGYALQTLNPHQNATIISMADLIIPATETPGAKAVNVNEFIDVILTGWANDEERARFLTGLDKVDKRTNALFGKNFIDLTVPQQEEILRGLDGDYAAEREERSRHLRRPRNEHYTQLDAGFFGMLKHMTLYGYYTSQVGFEQELREQIIPGSFHGCVPVPADKKA